MTSYKKEIHVSDYSPGMILLKSLAPAETQSLASPLMISRIIEGGADLLLKILAFLSFQIVQLTSMTREAISLRFAAALKVIVDHHSLMERPGGHSLVRIEGNPIHPLTISHTLFVNRHWEKRCAAVS